MNFDPSSRSKLTTHDLGRFTGDTIFDRLARAVCEAECLPRKELYEAWEVARRVRRRIRGRRIIDLAGGHGLLAHVLLLLDDTSPSAVVVDRAVPASAAILSERLAATWPRLRGRVRYDVADLGAQAVGPDDLVVSCHACGALSDAVLARAVEARAAVAVLPCCHDEGVSAVGALAGWLDAPMAIDVMRAVRLEQCGYTVWTQTIPAAITPQNRLLVGVPGATGSPVS